MVKGKLNVLLFGAVMKRTALALTVILVFLSSAVTGVQTAKASTSEDLFDVDVLYAYVQPGAPHVVAVLNFTAISNLTLPSSSSITEVYTIRVFSRGATVGSKGAIGSTIGHAQFNGSFLINLAMGFGTFSASEGGGMRFFEAPYEPLNPSLVEPISLSVVRLGWITLEGDSAQTQLYLNETVKHVELSKYQNGYLYNTLFSQDELSQIDLLNPLLQSSPPEATPTDQNMGPTSPPTSEPLLTQEQTEIILGVTVIIAVLGAGLGLLIYLVRRK
jgi:hypothetical protein